jgi:putative membrane protein
MNLIASATAVLALSIGSLGLASPAPPRSQSGRDDVREFIRGAGESGQAEVAFAGVAQQRSQHGTVRELAARLEREHRAANQELMTLARAKQVEIPGLSTQSRASQRKLEDLSGAAFDREYIGMMVKAHDASIARFSAAVKSEDADVRAFAVKTLPTLRAHMEAVERARKAIGGTDPPN